MSYTKLFSSIVHSTVWREELHTKVVWITMLALSNREGEVEASIPGIAGAAGVTVLQCEDALARLAAPDPYSRTKEYEGRRIAAMDGGWLILNYTKHRTAIDTERRREQVRLAVARHRAKRKRESNPVIAEQSNVVDSANADAAPDAAPDADTATTTKAAAAGSKSLAGRCVEAFNNLHRTKRRVTPALVSHVRDALTADPPYSPDDILAAVCVSGEDEWYATRDVSMPLRFKAGSKGRKAHLDDLLAKIAPGERFAPAVATEVKRLGLAGYFKERVGAADDDSQRIDGSGAPGS